MKNCTRKNRQTSKKCPRRSYRKTRRNGGGNPHHRKMTKQEEKESKANNKKARPQVKKGPSDKFSSIVSDAFNNFSKNVSNALNKSRATKSFNIPGKTDVTRR